MSKIAYLHGLGAENSGPKFDWLHLNFQQVYGPSIDYLEEKCYSKIKEKIQEFSPEIIIGSSMGGYFAFLLAQELNIKALLFNPALHSRSMDPDIFGFEKEVFQPKIQFVFGRKDEVIQPEKTISLLLKKGFTNASFLQLDHAHDTPFDVFVSEISKWVKISD